MNGKHPIDELFARGLSDAEATPPPAVWEGIVRKRGSGHRFALLMRRYWGLGLLLLLLGGTTTYALYLRGTGTEPLASTEATRPGAPAAGGVAPATPIDAASAPAGPRMAEQPVTTTDPGPAAAVPETPQSRTALQADPRSSDTHLRNAPGSSTAGASAPQGTAAGTSTSPARNATTSNPGLAHPLQGPALGASVTASSVSVHHSGTGATNRHTEGAALDPSVDYFATPIQGRPIGFDRPQPLGSPERNPATAHYAPPKGTWWFGVFGAAYTEQRTWAGGDEELRRALERTEVPHYPLGVGLSFGHTWPSGLHLSSGAEWIGSRYDFRHDDRIVTESTEVHNFIVTLDASVLVNISDTVTTTNEVTVHQQAMNRFSTLRVPLELGWQKNWKRWHYGIRGGLAMEHLTQRGGYTLERVAPDVPDASGIRSVEAMTGKRTTTLLSGLLGLDLGYSLTERLVLGITPTYAKGLMRISSTPDPYAVPERIGIRVGLTYHIPHD